MTKELRKVRALNNAGIEKFHEFISETRKKELEENVRLDPPDYLLSTPDYLDPEDFSNEIDGKAVFGNRYEMAKYLAETLGEDFLRTNMANHGLWTWLALVWFSQLRAAKTQRYEHFIPFEWFKKPGEVFHGTAPLGYRHSVRTPAELVLRFGEKAKLFISRRGVSSFGDASEQLLSRRWIKSSSKVHDLLDTLYADNTGFIKKNALDIPPAASDVMSRKGYGGVRRLVLGVLPRVKLTNDIDVMPTKAVLLACGEEFQPRLKIPKAKRKSKGTKG